LISPLFIIKDVQSFEHKVWGSVCGRNWFRL